MGRVTDEPKTPLNITRCRNRRLCYVRVWSAAIAHQDASSLGRRCRYLPEACEPLQDLRLDEQHRFAATERQWLEHREVRKRGRPAIETRPGS